MLPDFLDSDTLLYIVLIIIFLVFFLWNRRQMHKNRQNQKDRNFRKRYRDRKNKRK